MNYLKLLWNLYKLKSNTKKSRAIIEKLQEDKLRDIICYAYEHSAYYRRTFENYGITGEALREKPLREFPVLDKQSLLENFDELITVRDVNQETLRKFDEETELEAKSLEGKYHVVHSSGSTGTPGYFLYDADAWTQMLMGIIRGALWGMSMPQIMKLIWDKPRIVYVAATDGRYGGAMAVSDGIDGINASQLSLDIKMPVRHWVDSIRRFKPNLIIGYPSAIKILAELVERGEVSVEPVRVISCGEPLSRGLRKYLEGVFHTEMVNIYGSSESLALGVETDAQDGMYLFDDLNYIEVEEGHIYVTCLYNYAQPLIRYKITDRLHLKDCNSHYPFSIVSAIQGRDEDLMWFRSKNGDREFLHPLAVEGICIEGLIDYQFYQTGEDSFQILAQVEKGSDKEEIRQQIEELMNGILEDKFLDHTHFSVRFVDKILPDPATGKKKLIVT